MRSGERWPGARWSGGSGDFEGLHLDAVFAGFLGGAGFGLGEVVEVDGAGADFVLAGFESVEGGGVADHAVGEGPGEGIAGGFVEAEDLAGGDALREDGGPVWGWGEGAGFPVGFFPGGVGIGEGWAGGADPVFDSR